MAGSDRPGIRAAARAAMQGAAHFSGFSAISAWVQAVDKEALPVWAVATPREVKSRDSADLDRRELTLAVVVKRAGHGDIEDALDADADAAEAAILAAIPALNVDCELTQTETRLDGEGERRIGTLTMAFTITYWSA